MKNIIKQATLGLLISGLMIQGSLSMEREEGKEKTTIKNDKVPAVRYIKIQSNLSLLEARKRNLLISQIVQEYYKMFEPYGLKDILNNSKTALGKVNYDNINFKNPDAVRLAIEALYYYLVVLQLKVEEGAGENTNVVNLLAKQTLGLILGDLNKFHTILFKDVSNNQQEPMHPLTSHNIPPLVRNEIMTYLTPNEIENFINTIPNEMKRLNTVEELKNEDSYVNKRYKESVDRKELEDIKQLKGKKLEDAYRNEIYGDTEIAKKWIDHLSLEQLEYLKKETENWGLLGRQAFDNADYMLDRHELLSKEQKVKN